jgi:hypothetical protein
MPSQVIGIVTLAVVKVIICIVVIVLLFDVVI